MWRIGELHDHYNYWAPCTCVPQHADNQDTDQDFLSVAVISYKEEDCNKTCITICSKIYILRMSEWTSINVE